MVLLLCDIVNIVADVDSDWEEMEETNESPRRQTPIRVTSTQRRSSDSTSSLDLADAVDVNKRVVHIDSGDFRDRT